MKRSSPAKRILLPSMTGIKEKANESQNTEIQNQYSAELVKAVHGKFRGRGR